MTGQAPMRAVVRTPGTCGELAQGVLRERHFHVTCPIDLFSTVTVELASGTGRVSGPVDSPKAIRAAELTLQWVDRRDLDAIVSISSPLPRGKGMASSTADVAGAIVGVAVATGQRISATDISRIALEVEPSDGLMFPGIVAFDHRAGRLYEPLGHAPAMSVLVLQFEGVVDSVTFNTENKSTFFADLEPYWREAMALIREGMRRGDIQLLARGATLDAVTYADIVPQPNLPPVLALAKETGALGVNLAHSGTVMGLLFPPNEPTLVAHAEQLAITRFPGLERAYRHKLTDGGVRVVHVAAPQEGSVEPT